MLGLLRQDRGLLSPCSTIKLHSKPRGFPPFVNSKTWDFVWLKEKERHFVNSSENFKDVNFKNCIILLSSWNICIFKSTCGFYISCYFKSRVWVTTCLPKPQQAWEVGNPLASPSSNTQSELLLIILLTWHNKLWEQKGTFRDMALPAGLLFPRMPCTDIEFRSQDGATGQMFSPAKDSEVHNLKITWRWDPNIDCFFSLTSYTFKKTNPFSNTLSVNLRDAFEDYFLRSGNEQLKKKISCSLHISDPQHFYKLKSPEMRGRGDFKLWKWLDSIPGPIKTKSSGLRPDHTALISQATLVFGQNGGAWA